MRHSWLASHPVNQVCHQLSLLDSLLLNCCRVYSSFLCLSYSFTVTRRVRPNLLSFPCAHEQLCQLLFNLISFRQLNVQPLAIACRLCHQPPCTPTGQRACLALTCSLPLFPLHMEAHTHTLVFLVSAFDCSIPPSPSDASGILCPL